MSILIDENTTFIMWEQHRAMNCAASDLSLVLPVQTGGMILSRKLRVSTRSTEFSKRQ